MMRRRKLHSSEHHDRWLVSYADFITLLFAFFVVMFATNHTDKGHARALSESIQKAFKNGTVTPKLGTMLGGGKLDEKNAKPAAQSTDTAAKSKEALAAAERSLLELSGSLQTLESNLKSELENGAVHLSLEQRGLIISLDAAAFFPPGGDAISPSSYLTIGKVADVLKRLPNALRLEGHTDSLPISNTRFQNNWELSAARSIAMLRVLNERYGVERQRMAIVGYADTEAVDSNDTEQGRGRNRRVDIVIVSRYGMQSEPAQAVAQQGLRGEDGKAAVNSLKKP
jgi:chemotaxis protein MotB